MTLSVKRIARLSKPGRYADGHGLYLQVTSPTSRSWIFRYERNHRERFMGLGPLHTFTLDEAREMARKARQGLREGKDPIEVRKAEQRVRQLQEARTRTFKLCADDYFEFHQDKWRNDRWRKQFGQSLRDYVLPKIGHLPVAEVDTDQVLRCVEPIWKTIPPTARRVLGRIEDVLSYATVHKYREGLNPARWDGHLENVLPKQKDGNEHHDALPYVEMPEFMSQLRAVDGVANRALELLCLTAMRTAEVRLAKWSEFDLDSATWTVPAARMKKSTADHRVPLSERAVNILRACPARRLGVSGGGSGQTDRLVDHASRGAQASSR